MNITTFRFIKCSKSKHFAAWLLGEWQKMGGKVIITSDSHDIASLTYGFDEAAAAIKAAGFTSVEVLTGHGFETQEL